METRRFKPEEIEMYWYNCRVKPNDSVLSANVRQKKAFSLISFSLSIRKKNIYSFSKKEIDFYIQSVNRFLAWFLCSDY